MLIPPCGTFRRAVPRARRPPRGIEGVVERFEPLGVLVDQAGVNASKQRLEWLSPDCRAFRGAQVPADRAPGIVRRHHERDVLLETQGETATFRLPKLQRTFK